MDGAFLLASIEELNKQLSTVDAALQEERRKIGQVQTEQQGLVQGISTATESMRTQIKEAAALQLQALDLEVSKALLQTQRDNLMSENDILKAQIATLEPDMNSKAQKLLNAQCDLSGINEVVGIENYANFKREAIEHSKRAKGRASKLQEV